jgi:hypothetical protein
MAPVRPCPHTPACPSAFASDREAARVVVDHTEQDWVLLCNGVVRIDEWELLPDGTWSPDPVSGQAQRQSLSA